MNKKEQIISGSVAFALTIIFSQIYLKNTGFSYDTGNFLFSLIKFDISHDAPHLPGYPLFVFGLKLINYLVASPLLSFKYLTLLFTYFSILLSYRIFRILKSHSEAWLYTVWLFSIPYVLFFNLVPESYAFDMFYPIFIFYVFQKRSISPLVTFIIGILGGFRPPSLFILLPTIGYLIYHSKNTQKGWYYFLNYLITLFAGILVWLIPVIYHSGGLKNYLWFYKTNNPKESIGFMKNLARFLMYGWTLLIPAGVSLVLIVKSRMNKNLLHNHFLKAFLINTISGILFFTIFHFSKGYALITAFSIGGILSYMLKEFKAGNRLIVLWITANLIFFLLAPYRIPSQDCYKAPSFRQIPPHELICQKSFSFYLPAMSHIHYLENNFEEFKKFINSKPIDRVFLGPMVPLAIRTLSFQFPKTVFLRLKPGNSAVMERFENINVSVVTDTLIQDVWVVIRNDNPLRFKFKNTPAYTGVYFLFLHVKHLNVRDLKKSNFEWLGR